VCSDTPAATAGGRDPVIAGDRPVPGEGDEFDTLRLLIGRAARVLVFTSAGVSTASGIPDYRGPQGV